MFSGLHERTQSDDDESRLEDGKNLRELNAPMGDELVFYQRNLSDSSSIPIKSTGFNPNTEFTQFYLLSWSFVTLPQKRFQRGVLRFVDSACLAYIHQQQYITWVGSKVSLFFG